jgi:hypothetical protein
MRSGDKAWLPIYLALSVTAGEGVLHPLKKFYKLKKMTKNLKKITKTFFVNFVNKNF